MHDVFTTLQQRGFIKEATDEQGLRAALAQPQTVYCGYDPTAASLHVGNLLSVMLLRHLQGAGHRVVVVVGGGTGMIGDPSGKQSERRLLTGDEIAANMAGQRAQFARFLDFADDRAVIRNNADWLLPLAVIPFLREVGRYFSVNQMLQHSTYRERMAGDGLSFIEFSYVLLQAYDFLHLYRECGCTLQVGGADQWFNILAGAELIRRSDGGSAFGLVTPLLTTSSGKKMGKSEAGAIWLDPARTSPYDYYQFWINTEDADVERFLRLYTLLPLDAVERLAQGHGAALRRAKEALAFEATRLCHGEAAADAARRAAHALFGDGTGDASAMPTATIDRATLATGIPAAQILVLSGLCPSRSAARRLIAQGGATINGERIADGDTPLDTDALVGNALLVRAGKKRFRRLVAV